MSCPARHLKDVNPRTARYKAAQAQDVLIRVEVLSQLGPQCPSPQQLQPDDHRRAEELGPVDLGAKVRTGAGTK